MKKVEKIEKSQSFLFLFILKPHSAKARIDIGVGVGVGYQALDVVVLSKEADLKMAEIGVGLLPYCTALLGIELTSASIVTDRATTCKLQGLSHRWQRIASSYIYFRFFICSKNGTYLRVFAPQMALLGFFHRDLLLQ